MKIISHRGNIIGRIEEKENSPSYIDAAISSGFDVEIDLRMIDEKLFLGHDFNQYEISENWLMDRQDKLWVHAKDLDVVPFLYHTKLNWFWHENDNMTQTSHGYLWCFPNVFVEKGFTVCFNYMEVPSYIGGVCTDEPIKYK